MAKLEGHGFLTQAEMIDNDSKAKAANEQERIGRKEDQATLKAERAFGNDAEGLDLQDHAKSFREAPGMLGRMKENFQAAFGDVGKKIKERWQKMQEGRKMIKILPDTGERYDTMQKNLQAKEQNIDSKISQLIEAGHTIAAQREEFETGIQKYWREQAEQEASAKAQSEKDNIKVAGESSESDEFYSPQSDRLQGEWEEEQAAKNEERSRIKAEADIENYSPQSERLQAELEEEQEAKNKRRSGPRGGRVLQRKASKQIREAVAKTKQEEVQSAQSNVSESSEQSTIEDVDDEVKSEKPISARPRVRSRRPEVTKNRVRGRLGPTSYRRQNNAR